MSQEMTAHEQLMFAMVRNGQDEHPSGETNRRIIAEYAEAMQTIETQRKANARMYEDLMRLVSAASVLADNAAGWCEHESAVEVVREAQRAYQS